MGRKKLKLGLIEDESKRRAMFRDRSGGLLRKVSEISTLCDVKASAIIYGPEEVEAAATWPCKREVEKMMKSRPHGRRKMDQQEFLKEKEFKLKGQLKRLENEIAELEVALLMYNCFVSGASNIDELSTADTCRLFSFAEGKSKMFQYLMGVVAKEEDGSASETTISDAFTVC